MPPKQPDSGDLVPIPAAQSLRPQEAEFVAKALSSDRKVFVDQSRATALGDIVAGDKTTNVFLSGQHERGIVGQLMARLAHEIETNQRVRHTIDSLQFFHLRRSHDGIDGLEAKLKHSGRHDELLYALERKEQFAKLLEKWSLYASAQEILAYLLAKAENEFATGVQPKIGSLSRADINRLITDTIVTPIVDECGVGAFSLNHSIAMGMLYWLAEQCFVRWHV